MVRPVRHSSRASPSPTIQRSGVYNGGAPNLISGCPNTALREQMRKSQNTARSNPPPMAKPFTAARRGLGKFHTSRW